MACAVGDKSRLFLDRLEAYVLQAKYLAFALHLSGRRLHFFTASNWVKVLKNLGSMLL